MEDMEPIEGVQDPKVTEMEELTDKFRKEVLDLQAIEEELSRLSTTDPKFVVTDQEDKNGTLSECLIFASTRGHTDIVESLFTFGADSNSQDRFGNSVLLRTAIEGKLDCCILLLEHGAAVDKTDDRGRTALHWACMNGSLGVVNCLLKYGAQIHTQDEMFGFTPIMLAARGGHVEVLKSLLAVEGFKLAIHLSDKQGETALFECVRNGRVSCTTELIKHGADIEHRCKRLHLGIYQTPLMIAVLWHQTRIVHALLKNNCKIDNWVASDIFPAAHGSNFSILSAAFWEREIGICKLLIAAGASSRGLLNDHQFHALNQEESNHYDDPKATLEWRAEVLDAWRRCKALKDLCRFVIRRHLPSCLTESTLDCLGLPRSLKEYVLIPELDEILHEYLDD